MQRFSAACAAALLTVAGAGAQGIVPDRTTIVTISAPVALPGTVLPAGEYMFRLADTQATRNVVQIFTKDRSQILATLITVSAERNEPSDDAVITFRETGAAEAPALRYWYYAGERGGHEFVYPRNQAEQIARASGESVLAVNTESNDVEQMKSGEISRIDGAAASASTATPAPEASAAAGATAEAGANAQARASSDTTQPPPAVEQAEPAQAPAQPVERTEPAAPSTPAPDTTSAAAAARPTEMPEAPARTENAARSESATAGSATGMTGSASANARPAGTSGTMDASAAATTDQAAAKAPAQELPRTASSLPRIGLLGFLALGAAFGLHALRRRLVV